MALVWISLHCIMLSQRTRTMKVCVTIFFIKFQLIVIILMNISKYNSVLCYMPKQITTIFHHFLSFKNSNIKFKFFSYLLLIIMTWMANQFIASVTFSVLSVLEPRNRNGEQLICQHQSPAVIVVYYWTLRNKGKNIRLAWRYIVIVQKKYFSWCRIFYWMNRIMKRLLQQRNNWFQTKLIQSLNMNKAMVNCVSHSIKGFYYSNNCNENI